MYKSIPSSLITNKNNKKQTKSTIYIFYKKQQIVNKYVQIFNHNTLKSFYCFSFLLTKKNNF